MQELSQPIKMSIVIATLNRANNLEKALQRIFIEIDTSQLDCEVIVIDGGSADRTLDVIKSFGDQISYWSSEPDRGEFEAFNKGIIRATGDLIKLATDDDLMLPGALAYVMSYFTEHPEVDVLIGHDIIIDERHEKEVVTHGTWQAGRPFTPSNVLRFWLTGTGLFFHRRVIPVVGLLTSEFVPIDVDYQVRIAKADLKVHITQKLLVEYHFTGDQGSMNKRSRIGKDVIRIILRYGRFSDLIVFLVRWYFIRPVGSFMVRKNIPKPRILRELIHRHLYRNE